MNDVAVQLPLYGCLTLIELPVDRLEVVLGHRPPASVRGHVRRVHAGLRTSGRWRKIDPNPRSRSREKACRAFSPEGDAGHDDRLGEASKPR